MSNIITLTFSPCVDICSEVDSLKAEDKLKCHHVLYDPGGGGINVSRVLKKLGGDSLALFYKGGPTGDLLENLLEREKITRYALYTDEWNRQNFTIIDNNDDKQYRFGMPSPNFSFHEWQKVIDYLTCCSYDFDYFVISGSIPSHMPREFIPSLIDSLKTTQAKLVIDTSAKNLARILEHKVFLIKPNLKEFLDLIKVESFKKYEIESHCRKFMLTSNCEVLLLSLGEEGVLLATENDFWRIKAPKVKTKSKIGAGDSMLGAMLFGISHDFSLFNSAILGVAAGTATTLTKGTDLCHEADVWIYYKQIKQELLNEKNV